MEVVQRMQCREVVQDGSGAEQVAAVPLLLSLRRCVRGHISLPFHPSPRSYPTIHNNLIPATSVQLRLAAACFGEKNKEKKKRGKKKAVREPNAAVASAIVAASQTKRCATQTTPRETEMGRIEQLQPRDAKSDCSRFVNVPY